MRYTAFYDETLESWVVEDSYNEGEPGSATLYPTKSQAIELAAMMNNDCEDAAESEADEAEAAEEAAYDERDARGRDLGLW